MIRPLSGQAAAMAREIAWDSERQGSFLAAFISAERQGSFLAALIGAITATVH
jgi:hypothetical protein